jgi:hypothetical protein
MPFRVTLPEHVPGEQCEAYLNELLSLAEWRPVERATYVLVANRPSQITDLRDTLESERRLHRLEYEETPGDNR